MSQEHGNHKHGHTQGRGVNQSSPTYKSWDHMKQRCSNPNHARWSRYGGRGISVCGEFQSFAGFLAELGERPSVDHCLCRIDHDKDYMPGNVEWGLKTDNSREVATRHRKSCAK
jgi:hypothetical protein